MPIVLAGPADVLSRHHGLARLHERIDVPVAKVTDSCVAPRAAGCREEDLPAFDRINAMRSSRGRSRFGPVVPHGDVDAVVVGPTPFGVGTRIEKRAADRMLSVVRAHRPAAPRVVVDLSDVELAWNSLRHVWPFCASRWVRRAGERGHGQAICDAPLAVRIPP